MSVVVKQETIEVASESGLHWVKVPRDDRIGVLAAGRALHPLDAAVGLRAGLDKLLPGSERGDVGAEDL